MPVGVGSSAFCFDCFLEFVVPGRPLPNQLAFLSALTTTLGEVREVTSEFREHYNHERPHQGKACGNRPLHTAFPTLPVLPLVPERIAAYEDAGIQELLLRFPGTGQQEAIQRFEQEFIV